MKKLVRLTQLNQSQDFDIIILKYFKGINTPIVASFKLPVSSDFAEHRARKEIYAVSPHTIAVSSLLSPPDF